MTETYDPIDKELLLVAAIINRAKADKLGKNPICEGTDWLHYARQCAITFLDALDEFRASSPDIDHIELALEITSGDFA